MLYNSTIADSAVAAGNRADGGDGDASLNTAHGSNGGNGGSVSGGLVAMPPGASIAFTTLTHGGLTTGAPGNGGSGSVGGARGNRELLPALRSRRAGDGGGNRHRRSGVGISSALLAWSRRETRLRQSRRRRQLCGFTLHGSLAELFRPSNCREQRGRPTCPVMAARSSTRRRAPTGPCSPRPTTSMARRGRKARSAISCAIEADYIFANGFD